MRVQVARYACFDLEQTSVSYALAQDDHHPMIPEKLESKDEKTPDLHTIFLGQAMVKFCHSDGKAEILEGCWCTLCRSVSCIEKNVILPS